MNQKTKIGAEANSSIEAFGVAYDVSVIAARIKEDLDAQADTLRGAGVEEGRRWAAEESSFEEFCALDGLRRVDISIYELCKRFESIADVLDNHDHPALQESETLARSFGSGFVAGALEVWDVVQPRVEG